MCIIQRAKHPPLQLNTAIYPRLMPPASPILHPFTHPVLIQSIHLSIHPSIYIQSSSLLSSIRPPPLYRPSIHNSSESQLPFIYPPLIHSSTIQLIYHPFPSIPSKIHKLFSPTMHLNKPSTRRPFNIHNLSFTHQPSIYPVTIPSSTLYTIHPTTIYHPLPIFPQSTLLYPSIHHL